MKGDSIIVEAHHEKAAAGIVPAILPVLEQSDQRFTISVAGQSGSGKSETATAIAQALEFHGIRSVIFQQDDYFVYPPKTNDAERRSDISWVGTQEVRLDLMDEHLESFSRGAARIEKPLVDYEKDTILSEMMEIGTSSAAASICDTSTMCCILRRNLERTSSTPATAETVLWRGGIYGIMYIWLTNVNVSNACSMLRRSEKYCWRNCSRQMQRMFYLAAIEF